MVSQYGAGFGKALRFAAAGLALSAGLATASAANATQYFLQSFTIDRTNIARLAGPVGSGFTAVDVYMVPLYFTANEGVVASTDTFNLVAFCVDIFHSISLSDRNLKYDDAYDLETNSKFSGTTLPPTFAGATDLSNQQIAQVGRLVNFGTELFGSADANKINKLSAVQGAIWQVINPGYTVDARNNAVDTLVAQYMNPAFTSDQSATFDMISQTGKYGSTQAKQAFAIAAAVPEPSTWAMLILGFGAMGAVLRRRRALAFA